MRPVFRDILFTSLAAEEAGLELIGMTVQMDPPELGLTGEAIVTDIQACPDIEAKAGSGDARRVVTATFHHSSGDVIDLVLADEFSDLTTPDLNPETQTLKPVGEAEPIGTTSNHPFWSVDRQEYVQAGQLRVGERLQTLHGDTKIVVSNLPRPGPKTDVYNLEVHAEHVYFVGQDGVLVHNAYNSGAAVRTSGNLRTETLANGTKRFYIKQNGRWNRVRKATSNVGFEDHHPIPKYLGGKEDQALVRLANADHDDLHRLINNKLRSNGFGAANGGLSLSSSAKSWEAAFQKNPSLQKRALNAVYRGTKEFDARYGTNVLDSFYDNIRNGRFRQDF